MNQAQRLHLEDRAELKDNKLDTKNPLLSEANTERLKKIGKAPQPTPRLTTVNRLNSTMTCDGNHPNTNQINSTSGYNISIANGKSNDQFLTWRNNISPTNDKDRKNIQPSYIRTVAPPLPPKPPNIKRLLQNNAVATIQGERNHSGSDVNLRGDNKSSLDAEKDYNKDRQVPQPRTIYFH